MPLALGAEENDPHVIGKILPKHVLESFAGLCIYPQGFSAVIFVTFSLVNLGNRGMIHGPIAEYALRVCGPIYPDRFSALLFVTLPSALGKRDHHPDLFQIMYTYYCF